MGGCLSCGPLAGRLLNDVIFLGQLEIFFVLGQANVFSGGRLSSYAVNATQPNPLSFSLLLLIPSVLHLSFLFFLRL